MKNKHLYDLWINNYPEDYPEDSPEELDCFDIHEEHDNIPHREEATYEGTTRYHY